MGKLVAMILAAGLVLPLLGLLGGCECNNDMPPCLLCSTDCGLLPPGKTMALDRPDHAKQIQRSMDIEFREMVEDIDYALLIDEPSGLTPYHLPTKPH